MSCDVLDLGGGAVAIVCSRGQRRRKCQFPGCVDTVVALCDFELAGAKAGKTCDMAVCSRHRRPQPGKGSDGSDHRDYCPTHDRIAKLRAELKAKAG